MHLAVRVLVVPRAMLHVKQLVKIVVQIQQQENLAGTIFQEPVVRLEVTRTQQ